MMLESSTPLYNHPLPEIESWLRGLGCKQDRNDLNKWYVEKHNWKAEISLELEEITVRYLHTGEGSKDIFRAFKYSLSREDIESAVFAGP
jgi:Protein of unknown function (DUF3143)